MSSGHRPLRDPPGDYGRFLDEDRLEGAWGGGRCLHPAPGLHISGLRATMTCLDCGKCMEIRLRFGNPKTFMISASDPTGSMHVVGKTYVQTAKDFIFERVAGVTASDDDGVLSDRAMQNIMADVLIDLPNPDNPKEMPPPTDFVAAWDRIGCTHGMIGCAIYANDIVIRCEYCQNNIFFALRGERFHVTSTVPDANYGMHGIDEVLGYVLERADMLGLPHMMADKMSDDPERDAAGMVELISLLERRGIIRRGGISRLDNTDELAATMSALNIAREEFELRAMDVAGDPQKRRERMFEDGRPIPTRQALEEARLAWPCSFEGVGVKVEYYNVDGHNDFCPKCGFSTHGGVGMDADWRRGCRECGYAGYVLDI